MEKLAQVLVNIGAPILGKVIGGPVGGLAETALKELAKELGVEATPDAVAKATTEDPAAARAAEDRMFGLWEKEAATLAENAKIVGEWAFFKDGWRPGLCWSLIVMWIWGLIVVPMLNGFGWKVSAIPVDSLLAFSTVVLTILGGGHTIKAVWGRAS